MHRPDSQCLDATERPQRLSWRYPALETPVSMYGALVAGLFCQRYELLRVAMLAGPVPCVVYLFKHQEPLWISSSFESVSAQQHKSNTNIKI